MKFLSTFLSLLLTPLVAVMPLQAEMSPVPGAVALTAEGSIPGSTTPSIQPTLQIRLADAGQASVQASSSLKGYAIVVTDSAGLPVSEVAVAIRLPEEGATGFFTNGARSAVAYTDITGIARFAQVNWGSTPGTVAIRVTAAKGELHAGVLIEQTIFQPSRPAPALQVSNPKLTSPTALTAAPASVSVTNENVKPAPGTPASVASVHSGATAEQPAARTTETAASPEPVVSIVNTAGNKGSSHASNKKWILLAVVAVGAGVGAAMAMSGKGGASAAPASTGVSIGTPTISVGH